VYYMDISPGFPRTYEESYQLISLHAYVDAAHLKLTAGVLQNKGGALNEHSWTVLGRDHGALEMNYRGCPFDVYEHAAANTYIAQFDFLIGRQAWPRMIQTTRYQDAALSIPVTDIDSLIVGKATAKARKVITANEVDHPFRGTHDFKTTLGPLLTGIWP